MVNAQQFLDQQYSVQRRGAVEAINFNNRGLIGELDLSEYTSLKRLDLYNNKINKINVSQNFQLERLDLGLNQLTDVDISNNKSLSWLSIGGNNINKNISHFSHLDLTNFYINENPIHGSHKALTKMDRLSVINASRTNLNEDIWWLPLKQIRYQRDNYSKANAIQPRGWNDLVTNHRYFLEIARERDQLKEQNNQSQQQITQLQQANQALQKKIDELNALIDGGPGEEIADERAVMMRSKTQLEAKVEQPTNLPPK